MAFTTRAAASRLLLRRLWRAVRLTWDSAPGWTLAAAILVVLRSALAPAALLATKLLIDSVTHAAERSLPVSQVGLPLAVLAAVALLESLLRSAATLVTEAQAQAVTDHVSDLLHRQSVAIDLEYYENPQYFDTLHRAQQAAPYRPLRIVNGLMQVAQNTLSLLALLGLLLSLSGVPVVLLLLSALPALLVRVRFSARFYRWQQERTRAERHAGYYHWLLTDGNHAKEVRLFALGPLFIERFHRLRGQLREERLQLGRRRLLTEMAAQVLAVVALFAALTLIVAAAVQGRITLGALVMYLQALQRAQGMFHELVTGVAGLYDDSLFLSSLDEFLNLCPAVTGPPSPEAFPAPLRSGIRFENVSFSYPGSHRAALHAVDLTIGAGEVVALVGENGSGKSTLVKLLCRLYDPSAGRITIEGVDLRALDPAALQRELGVVFQDYGRYDASVHDNIWYGDVRQQRGEESVERAVREAGAEEVIASLPEGYDTLLGRWLEEGEELSIGQWQKLALARAFFRNSPLLILDEPSSALDPQAEADVFERFRQLARGRTALIISHRLSTVRTADRIYVLESGHVAEHGSHDELIRRGGIYARLFAAQAASYK